jgi:hypothetical protein
VKPGDADSMGLRDPESLVELTRGDADAIGTLRIVDEQAQPHVPAS